MNGINRRQWLNRVGAAGVAAMAGTGSSAMSKPQQPVKQERLELADFQPKSMLHVPETKVMRSRFPVIDVHTHLTRGAQGKNGVTLGEEIKFLASPDDILPLMDAKNIRLMVNPPATMERALKKLFSAFSRHTLTGLWFSRSQDGTTSIVQITRDGRRTRSDARIRQARKD